MSRSQPKAANCIIIPGNSQFCSENHLSCFKRKRMQNTGTCPPKGTQFFQIDCVMVFLNGLIAILDISRIQTLLSHFFGDYVLLPSLSTI